MRVLFAALSPPLPATNGHRMRNWGLLRALVEEGHAVCLVAFADGEVDRPSAERLRSACDQLELLDQRAEARLPGLGRLRALFSPLPYGAWRLRSPAMTRALERLLETYRPDALILDDAYMLPNLPSLGSTTLLLNKHDVTHVIVARYLRRRRNPLTLAYGWLEYAKVRRLETRACQRASRVLVCSENDAGVLASLGPIKGLTVLPNVIDVSAYTPRPGGGGSEVVYVGALDWYPNQDAVRFFVSAILPLVRRDFPDARFVVAGRNAPGGLRARLSATPGVTFAGAVPDMRPILERAAVSVVPLRIGSGTRIKILEAAAMARPIVSTALGAEGLRFTEADGIFCADRPEALAGLVVGLLKDRVRREAAGAAARRWVERHYSLTAAREALRSSLPPASAQPPSKVPDRG